MIFKNRNLIKSQVRYHSPINYIHLSIFFQFFVIPYISTSLMKFLENVGYTGKSIVMSIINA